MILNKKKKKKKNNDECYFKNTILEIVKKETLARFFVHEEEGNVKDQARMVSRFPRVQGRAVLGR